MCGVWIQISTTKDALLQSKDIPEICGVFGCNFIFSDSCMRVLNPLSYQNLTVDKNFTIAGDDFFNNLDDSTVREVIQLKPQKITVKLRPSK